MAAQAESLSSCFIAICRKTYGQTFRQTSASGRRSKRLKWLRLGGFAIVKAMPDRKPRREDASRSARPEPVSLAARGARHRCRGSIEARHRGWGGTEKSEEQAH